MEKNVDVQKLKSYYPQLEFDEEKKEIIGIIHIECLCNDEYINDKFKIKIQVCENSLPKVWEISNKIAKDYEHLNEDRALCLATDLEQELYLKNHNLIEWIEEFVEKYFISYEYYERFGVFPFGEHSHGQKGTYEFLQKLFEVDSVITAKQIYEYVCTKPYRGHLNCPCGSKKKIRNCHGNLLRQIINGQDIYIFKENYRRMNNVGRNE